MGHYCKICGRTKPNERFSGKGHRIHVCLDCEKIPKGQQQAIEQEEEIFGFLKQSHISDRNIGRRQTLAASDHARIAELAAIVIEVAKVKPYKKRCLKVLAAERKDLLDALERTGLIHAHHWKKGF